MRHESKPIAPNTPTTPTAPLAQPGASPPASSRARDSEPAHLTPATPPAPEGSRPVAQNKTKRPLKNRALRWASLFVVCFVLSFVGFRWAGTTKLTGTVQRVYESGAESRFEFVEHGGATYVIGNQNVAFPYFKTEAQDLHAALVRFAHTRDSVEIRVWGLRVSWLGLFPNVISVEFAESAATRAHRRATKIADAALDLLDRRGVLDDATAVRDELIDVIERTDETTP